MYHEKIGICVTVLLSLCLSFNAFAMVNSGQGWPEIYIPNPATETRHDDRTLDYVWTWLDDEVVARFQPGKELMKRENTYWINLIMA